MMLLDVWLRERIEKTKEAGLYRKLHTMNAAPRPEMSINGRNQLVFSSNNYLGLAGDERLMHAATTAMKKYGFGSSGSRLTTGNTDWHQRLEEKIARFKKTKAAILFSSGYLANVGVLSTLPENGDVILSDRLNHASIIDGCRLSKADVVIYEHIDMEDLKAKLKETAAYRRRFIVTDGVFSMDGTIAPLDKIYKLARQYDAYVIVDDAHATGVIGKNGSGTGELFGVNPDVTIGTLSKAVGAEGGFVAGSRILIDFLLNHTRTFIFQTAMPPSVCAAACTALEIIETGHDLREQLFHHAKSVRDGLIDMGYEVIGDYTPIIPVIIGSNGDAVRFAEKLRESGIYAPAIRPPTVPEGQSRIRLTVTSEHTSGQIDYLLEQFYQIGKEVGMI